MTTKTQDEEKEGLEVEAGDEWPVIHRYSRTEAISNGVLVAVDKKLLRGAGYRVPVALTQAVYEQCVRVAAGVQGQDETERLWDILVMTRFAFQTRPQRGPEAVVTLSVRNDDGSWRRATLKALFGPGDNANETVLTIMLPGED